MSFRSICKLCERHEEKLYGKEVICDHVPKPMMHFRSLVDELRLEGLLNVFGDTYSREIQSMLVTTQLRPVFDSDVLHRALGPRSRRVRDFVDINPREFLISADPGANLGRSDTAVVSICFPKCITLVDGEGSGARGDVTVLHTSNFHALDRYCVVCSLSLSLSLHTYTQYLSSIYMFSSFVGQQ